MMRDSCIKKHDKRCGPGRKKMQKLKKSVGNVYKEGTGDTPKLIYHSRKRAETKTKNCAEKFRKKKKKRGFVRTPRLDLKSCATKERQ